MPFLIGCHTYFHVSACLLYYFRNSNIGIFLKFCIYVSLKGYMRNLRII
ncbi:hypothetical protein HMPREF2531_00521 [Bacteroides intestinalis]|uniref:Uncharacterized protein n=2 Tax=Bacteroides TaxID=816 RepID=A0A139LTQ4_9BACE|nr:hypothetical protein BACCELL_02580 [Bacteroides cellulosilyticus DSM 14838]KXT54831.1 hypothetical protein HMPREF2531_00521 [Bacteroides intestinalis]